MINTNSVIYKKLHFLAIFVVLAIIIWVAHFWHFKSFGLYEDDYSRISSAIMMSGTEFIKSMVDFLSFKGTQGRPLHPILIYLFAFIGAKLGGLQSIYIFGYGIILFNCLLFYLLLKRLYKSQFFAFIGALSFGLFPADTTKIYLTHSLGVQPSITFLLLAFHCYLSHQTKLSYLFIFTTLLSYETVFPIFFVAPFLFPKQESKILPNLIRHGSIMALMVVLGVIIRKSTGESVSGFEPINGALVFANPILGTITSILMYLYRPLETLFNLNPELAIILLGCFLFLALVLSRLETDFSSFDHKNDNSTTTLEKKFVDFLKLPKSSANFARPLFHGFMMLVLAYPLTLTTLSITINGRGTRVHTAAAIGGSILCACACSWLLKLAINQNKKFLIITNTGIAAFFSLLIGFGFNVQQDYSLSWQFQQSFWTDLIELCPDLKSETVILVEPTSMRDARQLLPGRQAIGIVDTNQIKANDWNLPKVLEGLYYFPPDWKIPPRVYRLSPNWEDKILSDDNLFQLSAAIPWVFDEERKVSPDQVIFLETKNQELTRRTEPLIINEQQFKLQQSSFSQQLNLPWEKTLLHDFLIRKDDAERIEYLLEKKT